MSLVCKAVLRLWCIVSSRLLARHAGATCCLQEDQSSDAVSLLISHDFTGAVRNGNNEHGIARCFWQEYVLNFSHVTACSDLFLCPVRPSYASTAIMLRNTVSNILARGARGFGSMTEINGVPAEVFNPTGSLRCSICQGIDDAIRAATRGALSDMWRPVLTAGSPLQRSFLASAGSRSLLQLAAESRFASTRVSCSRTSSTAARSAHLAINCT